MFSKHKRVTMRRIYNARIDTSACKDHDDIPPEFRVSNNPAGVSAGRGRKAEKKYTQGIMERRKELADGNRGSVRQTHAVPAHLYHGKIKETKDPHYWKDSKNLSRHNSCRVDNYGQ